MYTCSPERAEFLFIGLLFFQQSLHFHPLPELFLSWTNNNASFIFLYKRFNCMKNLSSYLCYFEYVMFKTIHLDMLYER